MDEEDVHSVVIGGVAVTSKPQRRPRKEAAGATAAIAAVAAAADEQTSTGDGEVFAFTADLLLPPSSSSNSSSSSMRLIGLEYLDHTADIIVHAVSPSLGALFACVAMGMFNYMTDLLLVRPTESQLISAKGRDLSGLLFAFLNEMHALYGEVYFFVSQIKDIRFRTEAATSAATAAESPAAAADTTQQQQQQQLVVECLAFGERFDRTRHSQGTEIKAVTFHQLKLLLTRQQQQQQQQQQEQQQEGEVEVVEDVAGLADLESLEAQLKDGNLRLEAYVVAPAGEQLLPPAAAVASSNECCAPPCLLLLQQWQLSCLAAACA
ncbi:hypothetical protein Esti_002662 [Eimeria stiedai]